MKTVKYFKMCFLLCSVLAFAIAYVSAIIKQESFNLNRFTVPLMYSFIYSIVAVMMYRGKITK